MAEKETGSEGDALWLATGLRPLPGHVTPAVRGLTPAEVPDALIAKEADDGE